MIASKVFTFLAGPVIGGALAMSTIDFVARKLPVVAMMKATPVSFIDGDYTAHVFGKKIRECLVVGGTFAGWALVNGVWREVPISFPDDPSPDSTRPSGFKQMDFGYFRWHKLSEAAELVRLTNMHNCDGQAVLTTTGPFLVDRSAWNVVDNIGDTK